MKYIDMVKYFRKCRGLVIAHFCTMMAKEIAIMGCSMVPIVQTIQDNEPLVNAVTYIDIRNVVKGMTHIKTDFHISSESRPWILPDFANACLFENKTQKLAKDVTKFNI
jgi:hypothetical protein